MSSERPPEGAGLAAVPSIGRASLLEPGAAAPEATATRDLYERHGDRIHGYCLRQLGSREEAEDAVQTTFMNAFGALRKGVVPESEAAWLFKIAENVCLSRRRSSWRRGRIESPADFGVIEEVVAGPETARDELIGIEDALAAMPTQQRRAILLREWQGLSYREIATELDVTQPAVETLIFRARRSLARGLTEPETVKPRERRGLRKALHLGDLASVFIGAKALLGGTAAAQAAIAVATVTAVAGVTARPASELVPDSVRAKPAPAVKPAAVTPPPVVPVSARAAEPRRPVVPVSADGKPAAAKTRTVTAEPRTRPTPAGGGNVPPSEPSTGAGPQSPAPGRDVAATRPGETGKPDATPGTPPHAAAPDEPEKSAKPETPAKPDPQAAAPLKPAKPETSAKPPKPSPTPPAGTGPKTDPPKAEPATLNRPTSSGRPEQDALPDRASKLPAEPSTPPEQAAEPEQGHRSGPPVIRRS